MSEQEWLDCDDRRPLLKFLDDKLSDRKVRLFAVACCRRLDDLLLANDIGRIGLELAEDYADDLVPHEYMQRIRASVFTERYKVPGARYLVVTAVAHLMQAERLRCLPDAHSISSSVSAARSEQQRPLKLAARQGDIETLLADNWRLFDLESKSQASLLKDLVGNPFRPAVIDPAWLTWRDGTVVHLALDAYEKRALPSGELDRVRLAVLADALEEAGCANADMIAHLRSPGPHVRGCWVVDLLLGKARAAPGSRPSDPVRRA